MLNEIKNKNPWILIKKVLPQHTDHFGVMWHGSYLNFLEEARVDALNNAGISYSQLSMQGLEIPVLEINIRYKLSFIHGEIIHLKSEFHFLNKIRLKCKTIFFKENGCIGAEALIDLACVSKKNGSIHLVRRLPAEIINTFLILEKGP